MNHRVIVCESTGKVMNIIEILGLSMSSLKFLASTANWLVFLPLIKTSFSQIYLNIRSGSFKMLCLQDGSLSVSLLKPSTTFLLYLQRNIELV